MIVLFNFGDHNGRIHFLCFIPFDMTASEYCRELEAVGAQLEWAAWQLTDEGRAWLLTDTGKQHLAMRRVLDEVEKDPDFRSGSAVLRVKFDLLGKRVIR